MKTHQPKSNLAIAAVLAAMVFHVWPSQAVEKSVPGASSKDVKRLLIIAPDAFHQALQDYWRYKQERRPAEIVSLEKILRETSGCDDPERVKRFLLVRRHQPRMSLMGTDERIAITPSRCTVLETISR